MTDEKRDPQVEIARIEAIINTPELRQMRRNLNAAGQPRIRPRNASSIIVIDGKPGEERVVMGKRNKALKFMPGALVFPGGSVDRKDGYVPCSDCLHPKTEEKLVKHMRGQPVQQSARALGVAAVRELAEETGLLVGDRAARLPTGEDWAPFREHGIAPELGSLRLLARAITPPGMHRRFDTWFFMLRLSDSHVVPDEGFIPSGELEGLEWLRPQDAIHENTREITRVILVELMNRLREDPQLDPSFPAPAYTNRNGKFHRALM